MTINHYSGSCVYKNKTLVNSMNHRHLVLAAGPEILYKVSINQVSLQCYLILLGQITIGTGVRPSIGTRFNGNLGDLLHVNFLKVKI